MKMKWWGWIGISVILYAANKASNAAPTTFGTANESVGAGIGDIGYALSQFPWAILYLSAGDRRNP